MGNQSEKTAGPIFALITSRNTTGPAIPSDFSFVEVGVLGERSPRAVSVFVAAKRTARCDRSSLFCGLSVGGTIAPGLRSRSNDPADRLPGAVAGLPVAESGAGVETPRRGRFHGEQRGQTAAKSLAATESSRFS